MKTLKALLLAAVCSSFLSITSFADEFGTKEEATALLERAVALVRVDKNRALDLFTSGEGGLIQKDLYVFCFAPDGTVIAHRISLDSIPLIMILWMCKELNLEKRCSMLPEQVESEKLLINMRDLPRVQTKNLRRQP